VEDAVVAELLRGGGVRATDAIYDYYAEDLYDYCLTFLDPEIAADALHDALLVAVAWHNRLEARDEFGLWLYALTRNECLRVLRRGGGTPPVAGAHSGENPSRRHYAAEDDSAAGVLREVYDLVHRHAFDTREIATVLGVSVNRAQTLADRSEQQLGGARRVITPANVRPPAPLPPELRGRVLASAQVASRVSYRGDLAAPRFRNGYPVPLDRIDAYRRGRTLKMAGAAAALLLVVGAAFMVPTTSRHNVVDLLGSSRPAAERVSSPIDSLSPSTGTSPSQGAPGTPRWSPVSPGQNPGVPTGPVSGVGGKCMEVADSGGANGAVVQLFQCTRRPTQLWSVHPDSTLRAFKKCLHVRNGGVTDGSEIQIQPCDGGAAQQWQHQPNGSLLNPKSGRCLEAPTLNASDSTNLVLWKCSGADNQHWYLPS